MDMRPSPARWFEIVVSMEDVGDAVEALASRAEVQFEWTGDRSAARDLAELHSCIARYRALAAELARYWPEPIFEKRCCRLPVEASAKAAVRRIERWRTRVEPELARLHRLELEREELDLWRLILDALDDTTLDLGALAQAGPALRGFCLVLPADADIPMPDLAVHSGAHLGDRRAVLGLAAVDQVASLCGTRLPSGGRCLALRSWFAPSAPACAAALPERRAALNRRIADLERRLRVSAKDDGIDRAMGLLERVDWFRRHAQNIRCSGHYCWITGWTSEEEADGMNDALRQVGVQASVSMVEPPRDVASPSVTRNPVWVEPFEVFTRAVGVPGLREADPTTWVALLVPLLFGYMCGDVGHGLIILAAGVALRSKTRLWPLLVFAGLASIGFGFVYGDIFGYHHLIDTLWVRPLEEPFAVLLAPLALGSLVLSLGVLLHAVGTCGRGGGSAQGLADTAQLLAYWGLLLALVDLRLGWLAVAGVVLCMAHRAWGERSPVAALIGIGELFESTLQMLLNTLSFVRVGAFALAHSALESVVIAIAETTSSLAVTIAIVVLGNLLVIVVEGMVVSIQTTRLVLFEFFMRFFEGRGRAFKPVPRPPAASSD